MKECSPDIMLLACSARVLGVVDLVNRHRSSAACGTLFGTEGTHTSARAICALKRTPSYHHFTCSSLLMSPLNSCQFWSHYQFVLHACCCSILHEGEPYLAGLDHTDHFIYQVPRTPGLSRPSTMVTFLLSESAAFHHVCQEASSTWPDPADCTTHSSCNCNTLKLVDKEGRYQDQSLSQH
jgi:hypothetical protein